MPSAADTDSPDLPESGGPAVAETEPGSALSDWLSIAVFVAIAAAAIAVIRHTNRDQWFFLDEWDFLADRDLRSLDDLFRPHNDHWQTIPIVLYRSLFRYVGLHHYWPYQTLTLAAHVVVATCVWIIARRIGAKPWIATASTVTFLFFGTARDNLAWGFQVAFTGALAMGLIYLLLVDHDEPDARRDLLGMACGLSALMFSGVGVVMVGIGATVVGLRRGWKSAMAHAIPLMGLFITWFILYGRHRQGEPAPRPTLGLLLRGVVWSLVDTAEALTQHWAAATLIAVFGILGLVLGMGAQSRFPFTRHGAVITAMILGMMAQVVLTNFGRAGGFPIGHGLTAGRYLYLFLALGLPAVAWSLSNVSARWPPLTVPMMVLLLVGLPGNIHQLTLSGMDRFVLGSKDNVLVMAAVSNQTDTPRELEPDLNLMPFVTVGWLRDGYRAGRIPSPPIIAPSSRANVLINFSFQQTFKDTNMTCAPTGETPIRLKPGDVLQIDARHVMLTNVDPPNGSVGYASQLLGQADGPVRLAAVVPVRVVVGPEPSEAGISVCR